MSDQGKAHPGQQPDALQAQLDALLAQTDEPDHVEASASAESSHDDAAPSPEAATPPPAVSSAANAPLDRVVDRTLEAGVASDDETADPSAEEAGVADAQTEQADDTTYDDAHVGEALASQIQSLLDDENDEQAASTDMQAQAELSTELAGSFESPEAMDIYIEAESAPAPADAPPAPPQEAAASDTGEDDQTIKQIDQMLADEADDALAGEFATVDDILSSDDHIASTLADEAAAGDTVQTPDITAADAGPGSAAESAHATDAVADIAATHVEAAAIDDTDTADLEQEFEQHFEHEMQSPQQVASGASAEDVGAELDDQPEQHALAKEADEATAQALAQQAHLAASAKLVIVERSLRRFCAMVNQPLQNRSNEVRQTVGWVGVVSLFNGI